MMRRKWLWEDVRKRVPKMGRKRKNSLDRGKSLDTFKKQKEVDITGIVLSRRPDEIEEGDY